MRRSPRQRLEDILKAIARIERFTAARTEADFLADAMLHDAVERNIEIISEATRHLPEDLKDSHPEIPWRDIRDIGNVLRHGYDVIDDRAIWNTVRRDLAPLKAAVLDMVARVENGPA